MKSGPTPRKKTSSGVRRRQRRNVRREAFLDQTRLDWLEGSCMLFGNHFEHVIKERSLRGSGGTVRQIIDAARQFDHELLLKAQQSIVRPPR